MTFVNGQVSVPKASVADGDLHRYQANVNGTEIRFLLYRKPNGEVVSVHDACGICGPVGFYKNGNDIICKNCSAPINGQSMGQPGGCNPIPLKSTVIGDNIVITANDLSKDLPQEAGQTSR